MTDLVKAASAAAWVRAFARLVAEHEDELTRLDAAIGDADHGANMRRGLTAAVDALDRGERWASPGPLLASTGTTLISAIGGAAGPLFGTFFLRMGDALHDPADVGSLAVALRAGLDGVVERGKAEPKDKTMYDALRPAVDAVQKCAAAGASMAEALAAAGTAADAGCAATVPLVARKGRASYLGERSVGHQDPGATTITLLFRAATRSIA